MPTLSAVKFQVKEQGTTVLEVTGADGHAYEVRIALIIPMVIDTGSRNPLDDMPMFNIPANAVIQVKPVPNA